MWENKYPELSFCITLLKIGGVDIFHPKIYHIIISIVIGSLATILIVLSTLDLIFIESVEYYSPRINQITNMSLVIFSLLAFHLNRNELKNLILSTDSFWPRNHLGPELEQKQTKVLKIILILTKSFVITSTVALSLSLINVILVQKRHERNLMLILYPVIDLRVSPNYELMIVTECVLSFMMGCFILGTYGIFYFLSAACYYQSIMLNEAIKRLDFSHDVKKNLRIFIQQHSKIIKFFKNVNQAYYILFSAQFTVSVTNFSMPLYSLATIGNHSASSIFYAVFNLLNNLITIYLLCLLIEINNEAMQSLSDTIYQSNWYSLKDKSIKSILLIVMLRAQYPESFYVLGTLKINMECFMTVVQMSYSFYTILMTLK